EHIGAKTFGLHEGVVVQNDVIEIQPVSRAVGRKIGAAPFVRLADAAGAMNEGLAEAAVVGLVFVFVAEMPLAKNAGLVARLAEQLREGRRGERQPLALLNGVRHSVAKLMSSAEDRGARWSAGGRDMKIRKARRHVVEAIEI